jgi:predicted transcriptional regulator
MIDLPLVDALRSADAAAKVVRFTLAGLREIETLDNDLAPEAPIELDRSTASLLRGMYEQWADESDRLLERVDRMEREQGAKIRGSEELRDAIGRTRARLSISLDDMAEGLRDAVEGRTVPMEEVKRELRLRVGRTGE